MGSKARASTELGEDIAKTSDVERPIRHLLVAFAAEPPSQCLGRRPDVADAWQAESDRFLCIDLARYSWFIRCTLLVIWVCLPRRSAASEMTHIEKEIIARRCLRTQKRHTRHHTQLTDPLGTAKGRKSGSSGHPLRSHARALARQIQRKQNVLAHVTTARE